MSLLAVDPAGEPAPVGEASALSGSAHATMSAGQDCGLAEHLRQALQRDPAVQAGLARAPRSARSVANAVMIWDGRWVLRPDIEASALEPVRRLIVATVKSASERCREEPLQGPLFIPVAGAHDTTVLTVGSGAWRWSQLLGDEQEPGRPGGR
jgi:hypothetical protein